MGAVEDAIRDISGKRENRNKLRWSYALHLAADEQALRLGENGLVTTEDTPYHRPLTDRCKNFAVIRGRLI